MCGNCIAHDEQHNGVLKKSVDLRCSPCFTSQLRMDKTRSTSVISTDSVALYGHGIRSHLGD